jgi:hypothetical protein
MSSPQPYHLPDAYYIVSATAMTAAMRSSTVPELIVKAAAEAMHGASTHPALDIDVAHANNLDWKGSMKWDDVLQGDRWCLVRLRDGSGVLSKGKCR